MERVLWLLSLQPKQRFRTEESFDVFWMGSDDTTISCCNVEMVVNIYTLLHGIDGL